MQAGERFPSPMSMSVPATRRGIWYKKRFAVMRMRISQGKSPSVVAVFFAVTIWMEDSSLIVDFFFLPLPDEKGKKSCIPVNVFAAVSITAISSGLATWSAYLRKNGSITGALKIRYS